MVSASVCTPLERSSGAVCSCGWWLSPSLLGTKIMAAGAICAMKAASWYGRLTMRLVDAPSASADC